MAGGTDCGVCATGLSCSRSFCFLAFALLLGFLGWFFGGVGFHGGFGFGHGDQGFGVPEIHGDLGDFFGRVADGGVEAIEIGLGDLDGIGADLLEFFEALFTQDFLGGGIVVEAAHGRAQGGHIEDGAFVAFDDLRDKNRGGVRILFAGFLAVLQKRLEIEDVAGADVHGGGAQEAGFANEFGVGFGVLWGFAAEVPAAAAELGAGPDDAGVVVLLEFLGAFFAQAFVGGEHFGFIGLVDIGVVFADAGELIDVGFAVDGLESEPTVAIEFAVGFGKSLGEGQEIGDLFLFHFDGENIEIISLRAYSDGRCEAHGYCEGPKGSAERHKSSLADDLRTGDFRGRNLVGGLYTGDAERSRRRRDK